MCTIHLDVYIVSVQHSTILCMLVEVELYMGVIWQAQVTTSFESLTQLAELCVQTGLNDVSLCVWMLTKVAQIVATAHRDL